MGARHTGHVGPRLELRRRRAPCAFAVVRYRLARVPVPAPPGRLRRGAAVAGGGSRAVGYRRVPNCRGRRQRRSRTSPRRSHSSAARPASPRLRLQVLVYPRAALRLGHRIDAQRLPNLRRARRRVAGRTTSRTRTTAKMPWPRRSSPSSAVCRPRASSRPSTTRSATRGSSTPRSCGDRASTSRPCGSRVPRTAALGHGREDDLRPEARRRDARSRVRRRPGMIDHRPSFPEGPYRYRHRRGAGRS